MSHTFARIHIHLIFSTKERQKLIPQEMQSDLWSYMGGICHNKGIEPIAINGTDNHAHVLFHLPPTMALAKAVNLIKANSSRWMGGTQEKICLAGWLWRLQRERIQYASCDQLHPRSGKTSSQTELRAGICGISQKAPYQI